MSGEDLKNAAIQGKHELLCQILKDRANACSADEYGLTALMYACWNGHVEAVKYLASNPMGVDKDGQRRSCIDLTSCKGYTALHLTALDAPDAVAAEITTVLLLLNAETEIRCREGMRAYDIAMKLGKTAILKSFHDIATQDENIGLKMEMTDRKREFKQKYDMQYTLNMNVEPFKAKFEVPSFLFEEQRVGAIAPGMVIHENQIIPLVEEAFTGKEGLESIHCLTFAREQAQINQERRANLISAGDPSFSVPAPPKKKLLSRRKCAKVCWCCHVIVYMYAFNCIDSKCSVSACPTYVACQGG